jgi:hypothetical protein
MFNRLVLCLPYKKALIMIEVFKLLRLLGLARAKARLVVNI